MEAAKRIPMYPVPKDEQSTVNDVQENYSTGHVKIYRSLKDHWLWKASKKKSKLESWLDLIMLAQFENTKEPFGNDLIMLKKGQLLTSQDALSKAWRWDRNMVRSFLRTLSEDKMIEVRSTVKYTIITICKYDSYHKTLPTKHQQTTNRPPTDHHIQELKELKEIYGGKPPKPTRPKSYKNWTDEEFVADIKMYNAGHDRDMLNAFYKHWGEKMPSGKMLFQSKSSWETKKRLETWQRNEEKWSK